MSYRCLRAPELIDRPELLYTTALQYSQYLWLQGHTGRAILALARALYCEVPPEATALQAWPLPYQALHWLVRSHHSDDFPGNPRISFQHQASRLRGEREDLRRARAWAAWAIIRQARSTLTGDPTEPTPEPTPLQISELLIQHGHENESALWHHALLGEQSATCGSDNA